MQTRSVPHCVAPLIIASLAACGGREVGLPALQPARSAADDASKRVGKGSVEMRVVIPRRHGRRGAHYISPATRSLAITIVSAQGVTTHHNVDLTPATNPHCSSTGCSIAFSVTLGRSTFALTAFDGLLNSSGTPTGHALSADLKVPVTILAGRANRIGVTLDGIPKTVALVPSPKAEIRGSEQAFALSKCYSHTPNQQSQAVTVLGVDADGNFILGAGAPASSLTSDDAVRLAVSASSPASPGTYLLSDPTGALPAPHSAVHLTAKVTPAAASGGAPATETFTVTFDASICGVFTNFPIPTASSFPYSITNGSDGALWFTEFLANKIGRITTSGAISEIATSGTPYSIAAGPQNTIWFTQCSSNQVGQIATSGGTVYESHVPTANSGLFNITSDPHGGYPWFTETLANNIATLRPSGFGIPIVRETAVTTSSARPYGITGGPDGAIWFTEEAGNNIGRYSSGAITEFTVPTSASVPEQIASGPDGNLWFTEAMASKIGRITTSGTVTEFPIPTSTSLEGIAAGPDGAMYFTETGAQKIGRISTAGVVTEFPLSSAGNPSIITQGPDGAMWFAAPYANAIVRMQ